MSALFVLIIFKKIYINPHKRSQSIYTNASSFPITSFLKIFDRHCDSREKKKGKKTENDRTNSEKFERISEPVETSIQYSKWSVGGRAFRAPSA